MIWEIININGFIERMFSSRFAQRDIDIELAGCLIEDRTCGDNRERQTLDALRSYRPRDIRI